MLVTADEVIKFLSHVHTSRISFHVPLKMLPDEICLLSAAFLLVFSLLLTLLLTLLLLPFQLFTCIRTLGKVPALWSYLAYIARKQGDLAKWLASGGEKSGGKLLV